MKKSKLTIVDYGMGNLRSISNALEFLGFSHEVVSTVAGIQAAEKLILPGVGSFAQGMKNLRESGLAQAITEKVRHKTPIMGICLGMQLLAERGTEGGNTEGLGFMQGEVTLIEPKDERVRLPFYGWEALQLKRNSRLMDGLDQSLDYYFVHSYAFRTREDVVVATYNCGNDTVAACVEKGHIWGAQFHPEKSKNQGLKIIQNFGDYHA